MLSAPDMTAQTVFVFFFLFIRHTNGKRLQKICVFLLLVQCGQPCGRLAEEMVAIQVMNAVPECSMSRGLIARVIC